MIARGPMNPTAKSILDPTFRYTTSVNTNLRRTFARIRREQRRSADGAARTTEEARLKVLPMTRKTMRGR